MTKSSRGSARALARPCGSDVAGRFASTVYIVAPPKQLEPGNTCLQQEPPGRDLQTREPRATCRGRGWGFGWKNPGAAKGRVRGSDSGGFHWGFPVGTLMTGLARKPSGGPLVGSARIGSQEMKAAKGNKGVNVPQKKTREARPFSARLGSSKTHSNRPCVGSLARAVLTPVSARAQISPMLYPWKLFRGAILTNICGEA